MKRNGFLNLLKGGLIGASMLLPGVSGGTAAIILGIYDDLLHAVSRFSESKKKHAVFLLEVGIGALIGIFLFARLLLEAVNAFPMPMMFLFLGAITGSIPALIKKTERKKFKVWDLFFLLIGTAIVFGLSRLPQFGINFHEMGGFGFFLLLLAGLLVAVALILPGISASYVLLVLGLYEITLSAIQECNLLFLAPLLIGVLVGVLLTARLLETAMKRFPKISYLMIAGFVAGSMAEVFPGFPSGINILLCGITLLTGFFTVFFCSKLPKKKGSEA